MNQFPHRVSRVQLLLRVASPYDASSHQLSRVDTPRISWLSCSKHKGPKNQRLFPSFEKRNVGKYDQSKSKSPPIETNRYQFVDKLAIDSAKSRDAQFKFQAWKKLKSGLSICLTCWLYFTFVFYLALLQVNYWGQNTILETGRKWFKILSWGYFPQSSFALLLGYDVIEEECRVFQRFASIRLKYNDPTTISSNKIFNRILSSNKLCGLGLELWIIDDLSKMFGQAS